MTTTCFVRSWALNDRPNPFTIDLTAWKDITIDFMGNDITNGKTCISERKEVFHDEQSAVKWGFLFDLAFESLSCLMLSSSRRQMRRKWNHAHSTRPLTFLSDTCDADPYNVDYMLHGKYDYNQWLFLYPILPLPISIWWYITASRKLLLAWSQTLERCRIAYVLCLRLQKNLATSRSTCFSFTNSISENLSIWYVVGTS